MEVNDVEEEEEGPAAIGDARFFFPTPRCPPEAYHYLRVSTEEAVLSPESSYLDT